jgi:chaperonin GroEL (HSP60 family)
MGYIRGLQNALGLSEEDRVRALALAAARAIWESEAIERGGGRQEQHLRKKLERTAWLVKMQFLLLRAVAAVLYVIGWLLPSLR